MRVTAAYTRAPRVYVLDQREFHRLRLPRATTPASLPTIVCKYAGDAACEEVAQTLPTATGALHVRVFFCSGGRAVVAFVHYEQPGAGAPAAGSILSPERACGDTSASALQHQGQPLHTAAGGSIASTLQHQEQSLHTGCGGSILGLERACRLAGPAAAAVFASLWHSFHTRYTIP